MTYLPVQLFSENLPAIQALLKELVEIESPTSDKAAVDRLGARISNELKELGGATQTYPQANAGDHLLARWGEGQGGILVLGHMDTVFELGTLALRPFKEVDGKLYGPGVLDMKGGIALLLVTLRMLKQHNLWPAQPLTTLFTSDEETGSLTSRELIESQASQAAVVLCLEPGLANGALKTARKGTGDIELRVRGVAAHAGVEHERGRNTIEELAHHILSAQGLTDYARGTTVNVGVASGGTRPNVVPEEAGALIDFRVTSMEEVQRLEEWAHNREPIVAGTQVSAALVLNRPPMPRDKTMARTFARVQVIARELGMVLTEGSTGGGSDANFVAPLGIPVLDGLGAVGEGAHSEREYVRAASLAERAALLAGLLLNW